MAMILTGVKGKARGMIAKLMGRSRPISRFLGEGDSRKEKTGVHSLALSKGYSEGYRTPAASRLPPTAKLYEIYKRTSDE